MAELNEKGFLRDLAKRLMNVPVMYGVDQGDVDRLAQIASDPDTVAVERAPTGWIKGHVTPSTPDGPAEYDVDFVYGDDSPEPTGWTPLYRPRSQP